MAAILQQTGESGVRLSEGICKEVLNERSKTLFDKYCASTAGLDEICKKIRIGLLWDVNIVIDLTDREYTDYDYKDIREAPIGLTAEDYEEFESAGERSWDASYDPDLETEELEFEDILSDFEYEEETE